MSTIKMTLPATIRLIPLLVLFVFYGAGSAEIVSTYGDGRNAHIIPYIETVKVFGFGDTLTIREMDVDSVPQGTSGRKVDGNPQRDSAIFLTYATIPSFIRDSAQIDSFYSAWGATGTVPYLAFVPKDILTPTGEHPNEPDGMTEMAGNNINHPSDVSTPNKWNFLDSISFDPYGMRATAASMRFGFLTIGTPQSVGIGAPNSPAPIGKDTVLIGFWPNGFGDGFGPFSVSYERNWSGNPSRKSMYWSMYIFVDPAFIFNTNSTKMFWYSQNQNNNHFVTFHRNDTNSVFGLFLQFVDGPPDGVVPNNKQYAGMPVNNLIFGSWFKAEFLFVANSANAVKDGIYRMWLNGELKVAHDTIYYFDSADTDKAFNIARWNPTWGGGGGPVPHDQYILLDDWYISYRNALVP